MKRTIAVGLMLVAAVISVPLAAQEPAPQAPNTLTGGQTPVPEPINPELKSAMLEQQVATLQKQLNEKQAALNKVQQALSTNPGVIAQDTENAAKAFTEMRAQPFVAGCKKAGGTARVVFNVQAQRLVFDSCEFR